MKKMISALVALASIALGHASPAEASAPVHESYSFRGDTAYAFFWDYEPSEDGWCGMYTGVDIYAHSEMSRTEPGAPDEGVYLVLYAYQYDTCTWSSLLSGYAVTHDFDLVTHGMNSATVSATLELHDWMSNMSVPVDVNIVLTGEGDAYHGMNSSLQRSGNYMVKSRSNGSWRMASGAGEVVANGVNLAGGEGYAQLASVQSGANWVYKF